MALNVTAVPGFNYVTDVIPLAAGLNDTVEPPGRADIVAAIFDYVMNRNTSNRTIRQLAGRTGRFTPNIPSLQLYTFFAVVGAAGFSGNLLLFAMALQPELRQLSYSVYLIVLSVCDTLSLAMNFLDQFSVVSGKPLTTLATNVHECRLLLTAIIWPTYTSPALLVCFSIDRYIALVFPLKKGTLCTVRTARIACAIAVVLPLIIQIPSSVSTEMISDLCAINVDQAAFIDPFEMVLTSIVPTSLLIFLNIHSLVAIHRGIELRRVVSAADNRRLRMEGRRISVALLLLPIYNVLTNLPFIIMRTMLIVTLLKDGLMVSEVQKNVLSYFPYARMVYTTSFAINVYLLLVTSPKFRKIARDTLRFSLPCLRHSRS